MAGFGALLTSRFPREARLRPRPMGQCFSRIFSLLRPQPHSRSPRKELFAAACHAQGAPQPVGGGVI